LLKEDFTISKDRIKLEFQHLINKRNNLIAIILVISTGIVGLVYNINHPFSLILLFIGIPAIIMLLKGFFNIEDQIKCLIKEIDDASDNL